jgi:putative MATE family efflux protein
VTAITLPITAAFWLLPGTLIGVLSSDPQITDYGTQYLRIVGLGVPFAALNLVGSRVLVGVNDARTAMYVRGGGAVANVCLNAVLIFGLGMGVTGAAVGTVLANVLVTASFVVGLVVGRLPLVGAFPITVSPVGRYVDAGEFRDLVDIGLPVVGRNSVWTVARFPLLAIVGMFGGQVVAAYVISRRVLGLMNTPGWGFGLAASSLVGQALGAEDEAGAAAYGREVTRFAVATYVVAAALAAAFAEQLVVLFVDDPSSASVPVAVLLVYAAAGAVIFQGVNSTISGALDATGDTNWPFYSRLLGMFGVAIPLTYLGATTPLGLWGLVLAFFAETTVPAAINYYRFSTGKWKRISRGYRPDAAPADD